MVVVLLGIDSEPLIGTLSKAASPIVCTESPSVRPVNPVPVNA